MRRMNPRAQKKVRVWHCMCMQKHWDFLWASILLIYNIIPICQNLSRRPFFSGSVLFLQAGEKGCNGAWVGITNWMTTPIWSHSLHRPLSDGGGGSVSSQKKKSIPPSWVPWYDWTHCVPRENVQRVRLWFVVLFSPVFVRLQPLYLFAFINICSDSAAC